MRFELFVALRYLFARRKQAFIYIISAMSVLGVAIGVAALVVVLGVYNGFTTDIRDKILGANAHIIVSGPLAALTAPPSDADFEKMRGGEAPELSGMAAVLRRINATPGVVGSTPFLYAEGMLSSPRGVKGVVLRGIDPKTAPDVLTMLDNLSSGSVADLNASVEGAPPACSSARNWRSASAWSWAAASTSFRLPDKRPPPVSSPASVPTRLRAFSRPACSNTIVARVHLPCGCARSAGPAFRSDFRHRGHRQGRIQGRYRGRRPQKGARPAGFRPDMDGHERQSLRCVET